MGNKLNKKKILKRERLKRQRIQLRKNLEKRKLYLQNSKGTDTNENQDTCVSTNNFEQMMIKIEADDLEENDEYIEEYYVFEEVMKDSDEIGEIKLLVHTIST